MKLTCPYCGESCLQIFANIRVLVEQDDKGLLIDTECTNEMHSGMNDLFFEATTGEEIQKGIVRVSKANSKDLIVVCHSDACGGTEMRYSEIEEEERVAAKSW
jgi:hypothetical protein